MWYPIIKNSSVRTEVVTKIDDIHRTLSSYEGVAPESLFAGDLGCSLFQLYYYKHSHNDYALDVAVQQFTNALEYISTNSNQVHLSFARGISGLRWFYEFAKKNSFFKLSEESLAFSKIDDFLDDYMIHEIKKGNYDYMHGALGVALFFLCKEKNHEQSIEKVIDVLYEDSVKDLRNNIFCWEHYFDKKLPNVRNIGLSHGIPSILSFLISSYHKGIRRGRTYEMIEGVVNYLLFIMQNVGDAKSYFPYKIVNGYVDSYSKDTRLAWCYGDIGICLPLWRASQVLNDKQLQSKVIEILNFNSYRKDLSANMVFDAGLCHGSAGIAHIFNRFFHLTGIESYREIALYWYMQTLSFSKHEDGIAGYKYCISEDGKELINSTNFLEGVAGTGLALIASITDFEPTWDECLLIS